METPADLALYAVEYGTSRFPLRGVFGDGAEDGTMPFSWLFYVLRWESRVLLIDTGFRDAERARKYAVDLRNVPGLLTTIGIDPERVTDVVLTHADFDHADNLDLFPHAAITVQQRELARLLHPDPDASRDLGAFLRGKPDITAFDTHCDIAGFLRCRCIGGHSPGSSVVELTRGEGTYVIPGDECFVFENARSARPVGYTVDEGANLAYLRTLQRMPGAVLLPLHEPAIFRRHSLAAPFVAKIF